MWHGEQAQRSGKERSDRPGGRHLQNTGSFLGTLWRSGQTRQVDGFRTWWGGAWRLLACQKLPPLQPHSHSPTQQRGTEPLLCTRLGTEDAELNCSLYWSSYRTKVGGGLKHGKGAFQCDGHSRSPGLE